MDRPEPPAPSLPPLGDDLPPVRPPSASFFVQLFLLPAMIVFGIMAVWYLFGKIAGADRSVEDYVAIIRSDRGDRWKAALDLSHLLREESVHASNSDLAFILAEEMDKALSKSGEQDSQYIEYLAGALGSFKIPTGATVLLAATRPERPRQVRRAALIALANLASRTGDLKNAEIRPQVESYLKDDDPEIRGVSALLLGKIGDSRATPSLANSLGDPVPAVRYNVATALGELGSDRAMKAYAEMLNADKLGSLLVMDDAGRQVTDQAMVSAVMENAIIALRSIAAKNASADFGPVKEAVESLTRDKNPRIKAEAMDLERRIAAAGHAEKDSQKGTRP